MTLSPEFMARLDKFAKLQPNWDSYGADVISIVALKKAEELAERALAFAPEPFTAPSADGDVMLKWTWPNGVDVEYFVSADWTDDAALAVKNEVVAERRVPDETALMALIEEASRL